MLAPTPTFARLLRTKDPGVEAEVKGLLPQATPRHRV